MYGGLCDLQLRERLPQPADDLLTHHILRGEVSCIDEIQPLRIQKVIVPQVGCHKGVAALSDGRTPWGNEDTQMLIDILGKYKVKATFFVVGDWVDKYPESVKALHDAGHEVMNHSNTHAHMSQLSKDEIIADVEACNDKIEAVTGVRPTLIRPPYGEYDDNVITAIRSIGMEPIQWDVDSLDWKDLEAPEIIKRVTGKVQSGSIVLFHNAALHTPEALPTIIATLLQEGYTFVPISEIILPQPYTIDHTGRQLPADAQAS